MAEPSMGNAKQFRGDSTEVCVSSSPWFNAEDIPADSWTRYVVQIEDVLERTGVKFNKGRSRPRELTLKFTGHEKELVVNASRRAKGPRRTASGSATTGRRVRRRPSRTSPPRTRPPRAVSPC